MTDPVASSIRARIEAQGFRRLADEAERDAASCPEGCSSPLCRDANLSTARWLRAEADRLDPAKESR